jgi:hypothetical protein
MGISDQADVAATIGRMVSGPIPLRLRPLEIGDLLDETFRMYRRHFFLFAGISLILAVPFAALAGYSVFTFFGNFLQQLSAGANPDLNSFGQSVGILGAGILANLALYPFVYAVTYAACESALGRPVTAWDAVMGAGRRYFHLGGYLVLQLLMALFCCLFPLWIWIWVGWVAVVPVMFIENTGLVSAVGRSWRLVQGRWWRTFLIVFLMVILVQVVSAALLAFMYLGELLLGLVFSFNLVQAITEAAGILINALVTPILQIAIVLIYFDLRVRREGLDLFQLAQRVPAPQPIG